MTATPVEDRPAPDFDPLRPESFDTFHREFTGLRERCPVAHSDAWNGFWALLRYEDVLAAAGNPELFTTTVQNVVPRLAFTGRRPPLHLDPPEHTPYRRALNPYFTPAKMAEIEPALRRIVADLLDPLVAAGGGDFCAEFTHRLPGYVFAEFFNLTPELGMAIREATREFVDAVQRFEAESVKRTSLALYDIARTIIAMRREEPLDPADDPTTGLLAARVDGEPLPEEMLLGTLRQFIVVGMVAPCVFIGSMVVHLAEHRDLQAQLRGDPGLIPAAVEEYLRLLTPYRGFARTPTRDVEIGGRLIRKDEPVALVYASANRDESVFPEPDEFVLNRPNIGRHLAFGAGPHRCAGAPLATLMLQVTLGELLARTSSIRLAGEVTMTGWPEWGTLSVPTVLLPAEPA
jgi:cytochrome P450